MNKVTFRKYEKLEPMVCECRKCGVQHGMGILDTVTQVHTPIDLCYDCLWKDGFTYRPPEQVVIDENVDFGKVLQEAQDKIIRDMITSSACDPQVLEDS